MKKYFISLFILFPVIIITVLAFVVLFVKRDSETWAIQSIDTMKVSRDRAREYADGSHNEQIEQIVENIANSGATHIAIDTPYDNEFVPYLKTWVGMARKNNLKVWFRGNFSGWEGWFDYEDITPEEHLKLSTAFILNNPDLFKDGDIFDSCTECENGVLGDPRDEHQIEFVKFMTDEYQSTFAAFKTINKNVTIVRSMNGDVASLVMNKETTSKMGGVVTIDHYVFSSDRMTEDIDNLAQQSGGKILLGEFGAPIPDIHGELSEEQQANWVGQAMQNLSENRNVIGLNYWTFSSGSTRLSDENKLRDVYFTLKDYYTGQAGKRPIISMINAILH